jgi:DNA (cytosine-5)-methyltransferase 1
MKVVGLFAGIGGFELGLSRSGHEAILTCENNSAAVAVLRAQFQTINHDDIRTLRSLPRDAELLCAGFPCQDLSQAGMTAGIEGCRSGLIGEVFRLLEARRVPWVIIENVPFMLHLKGGAALALIVSKLEGLGYRWAYRVVNSLAFGLPQRRQRVFLLASTVGDPEDVLLCDDVEAPLHETKLFHLAHGFYWTEGIRGLGWAPDAIPTLKNGSTIGIPSSPAILMPSGDIVKPELEDAERLQGFPPNWTAPAMQAKRNTFRWSLIGNAVSVPVSTWLGHRLNNPGTYDSFRDYRFADGSRWPKAARFDGARRIGVMISNSPVWEARPHLHEFLRQPGMPLSAKATAGFLDRTRRGSLRFPAGFLDAVAAHLAKMRTYEREKKGGALLATRVAVAAE